METQLEKINAVECRVRVQIPWEEISPRFDKKLRELQGQARVPGFRPGKVPPQMVERMFGASVREELARDIVQETFQSAVTQHNRVPLTQPVLEEGKLVKGEPFIYRARFEVPPELQPWIDAGKLVWIEPGDRDLVVRTAGACPYVGLPGERERQVIMGGEVVLTGLPTGEMICPFGD